MVSNCSALMAPLRQAATPSKTLIRSRALPSGDRPAAIGPPLLRTLDAIHLATALALVPDLDAFVTYDDRLAEAARALGLPVVRPA